MQIYKQVDADSFDDFNGSERKTPVLKTKVLDMESAKGSLGSAGGRPLYSALAAPQ